MAAPAAAHAETLADAVALAYASNPRLQAQRAQQRALDEDYVQARAALGPTVGVEFDVSRTGSRLETGSGDFAGTSGGTNQTRVSVNQPLLTSGRLTATMDAAKAAVLAGRERLRALEHEIMADVITAYVQVLRDQENLTVLEESVEIMRRQLADTDTRFRNLEDTATDRAQARSRFATAQGDFTTAQTQLSLSRVQYLSVVGQNPGTLAPIPDLPGTPATLDEALAVAAVNNPALRNNQFNEQVAQATVTQQRASFGPSVTFSIDGQQGYSTPYDTRFAVGDVVGRLTLSQPLYTAGLVSSRVRQAKERVMEASRLVQVGERTTASNVGNAWAQVDGLRRLITINEERVAALRIAYEGAREEQRLGLRSTLEVLNQAQELQFARSALVQSQANEHLSRVNLLRAMGLLDAERLAPGIETYDPARNFDRVKGKGAPVVGTLTDFIDRILAADTPAPVAPADPAKGVTPTSLPKTLPPPQPVR